jgi:uncharacterized protein YaaR (DUF327 family)
MLFPVQLFTEEGTFMTRPRIALSSHSLIPQLKNAMVGERIIFDAVKSYFHAPQYQSETEHIKVCRMVDDLVKEGKGLVFHRRLISEKGYPIVVREFVSVAPETIARLDAVMERVVVPVPATRLSPVA